MGRRARPLPAEDADVRAAQPNTPDGDADVVRPDLGLGYLVDNRPPRARTSSAAFMRPPPGDAAGSGSSSWSICSCDAPASRSGGKDVTGDRVHPPAGCPAGSPRRRRDVAVEGGIMGEDHAVRIALFEQGHHGPDPSLVGENVLHPESVHADRRTVVHELLQVVEVLGVAGMADDDALRWDASLPKECLLVQAIARRRMRMRRDRHAGLAGGRVAAADMTRATSGVMPSASVMTFSMPARTAVPAIPSRDVAHEQVDERVGAIDRSSRDRGTGRRSAGRSGCTSRSRQQG